RHYETDDQARDETFGGGPALVLQAVVQRLLDAIGFARGRIERAIANDEELSLRGADARGARQAIATALRLRSEARQIRRATTPLPALLRTFTEIDVTAGVGPDGWEPVSSRAARLVQSLDDDVVALDGILLALSATATLEGS